MISVAAALSFYNPANFAIGAFVVVGIFIVMRGVSLYEDEVRINQQKKATGDGKG